VTTIEGVTTIEVAEVASQEMAEMLAMATGGITSTRTTEVVEVATSNNLMRLRITSISMSTTLPPTIKG